MTWGEWKERIGALGIGDDTDITSIYATEDAANAGEMFLNPDPRRPKSFYIEGIE